MAQNLTRLLQILGDNEATPGTAETLTAADGETRVLVGAVTEYDAPKEERNLARDSLTKMGLLASTKALGITFKAEVNTRDLITEALEYDWALAACGVALTALRRIPIGAVTSGPVARGATMTGGTSAATGRVVKKVTNGDTHVYFEVLTGTFQAESLSFTGGASATSSAISEAWGWSGKPTSNASPATVKMEEDGFQWTARGAMGNLSAEFQSSRAGIFEFGLKGPKSSYGDQAMTASVVYDEEEPPIMQDATLLLDAFAPVFRSIAFNMNSTVVLRENGNATGDSGFETARITARDPKLTITLEHEDASTFAFFTKLDDNSKIAVGFRVGTVAGKTFWFFADRAQIVALPLEDNEGIRNLGVELSLTGAASSGDDEFEMLFI